MNVKLHLMEWSTCSIHLYWSHQYQVDHFHFISLQQTTLSEWLCFSPIWRYRKERKVGHRSASHWSNMKKSTTHMNKTCLALVWASQKFRHSFLDHSVGLLAWMDLKLYGHFIGLYHNFFFFFLYFHLILLSLFLFVLPWFHIFIFLFNNAHFILYFQKLRL